MKNKNILKQILIFGTISGVLTGCSYSGSCCANQGSSNVSAATPITIANSAIIPTFNGAPTTTVVYVHNNSKNTIKGITYTVNKSNSTEKTTKLATRLLALFGAKTTTDAVSDENLLINETSAKNCATIAANASCTLGVTTPLNVIAGSSVIKVSYQLNGIESNFALPVSYSQQATGAAGIYTTGGVMASTYGNNVAYGTVYAYGGGDQTYVIDSIKSSNPGIPINQQTISPGQELAAKQVVAIELKAPLTSTSSQKVVNVSTNVNIAATSGSSQYTTEATMDAASLDTPFLAIPLITPMDTANSTVSTTAYIYNYGNGDATSVTLEPLTGITQSASTCGATIPSGSFCQVTLSPTTAGSQGTGTLTANYMGGTSTSAMQTVTWYNSVEAPLLSISVPGTTTFLAAVQESLNVTISNPAGVSGVPFTISTITASNLSGSATLNITSNTCNGQTLQVGGPSCSLVVNVLNPNTTNNGVIKLSVPGTYINPIDGSVINRTQVAQMDYITTQNQAVLTANPITPTLTVKGDDVAIDTESVVITNSGAGVGATAIATISSVTLTGGSTPLSIQSDTCTAPLAQQESCVITLKLGPISNNTSTAVTGSRVLSIAYTSSGQPGPSPLNTTADYTINPNSQSTEMQEISPSGTSSGDGTSANPYVFLGSSLASGQSIGLTYANDGTNPITIKGINDTNSSMLWAVTDGCAGQTLGVSESCIITYTNTLATYASGLQGVLGATYARNLIAPELIYEDNTGGLFTMSPTFPNGSSQLYVNNQQATITNSATYSTPTLTVTNTITNAGNYGSYSLLMETESYFTGVTNTNVPASVTCSDSSTNASSLWTATCAIGAGVNSGSIIRAYTYYTALGTNSQDLLFKLSGINTAGGYIIDMSPLYLTQTVQ